MKHSFFVITMAVLFTACRKQEVVVAANEQQKEPTANSIPSPVPSYFWRQVSTGFPTNIYPYVDYTSSTMVMKVNEEVYMLAGSLMEYVYRFNRTLQKFEPHTLSTPDAAGFSGIAFGGYQPFFSFGNKIYAGSASHDPSYFYSIDPETGITQTLQSYPGTYDYIPISFAVGEKGYVISGFTSSQTCKVWEYDFAANTWTNIGISPLGKRKGAVAFVVNNKVYMGLGYEVLNFNGQEIRRYKNDWIEYTPGSSYNAIKANLPGAGRSSALGFIINNSLYLGFGSATTRLKDLWKYNSNTNTWTEQAEWPGAFHENDPNAGYISPRNIVVFSSGSRAFLVRGALNQFWQFTNSPFVIQ